MTKILVIDDDVIVRETIIQILEDRGYQVISAEDGKRGIASFRSEKPDLVITDIIMPEKEGNPDDHRNPARAARCQGHRHFRRRPYRQYRLPQDRAEARRVRRHCQAVRPR